MERRAFLAASTAATLAHTPTLAAAVGTTELQSGGAPPLLLELRRYRLRNGPMAARFSAYAKDALVPALGRAGIAPVGAWNVSLGPDSPTLHLLIPHAQPESLATLDARVEADDAYRRAAASFLALPPADPPFVSCESSLLATVPTLPDVRKPTGAAAAASRVFELRSYRSPSEPAGRRKIEMFEAGGELAIFARLGMHIVFFSRDVVGAGLPSLTYMLAFADVDAREKGWAAFRDDPAWLKLRDQPAYADIVSGIDSTLLRPTDYSQI
jgi:NIPSNAP